MYAVMVLTLFSRWLVVLSGISVSFYFGCQYNCISLGLTTAAVAAILSDRDVVGSTLFSLALNHKQVGACIFLFNVNTLPLRLLES